MSKPKKSRFLGVPYHVANSSQWADLTAFETKLLVDLIWQYSGSNNGTLTPSHSLLKKRGWERKKGSLYRAKDGLIRKGFIVVTRLGSKVRGRATYVALTWLAIDEPRKIKYDDGIKASNTPLGYWCKHPSFWREDAKLRLAGTS